MRQRKGGKKCSRVGAAGKREEGKRGVVLRDIVSYYHCVLLCVIPVVSLETASSPPVSLATPGMTLPMIVEKHRLYAMIMLGYSDWKSSTTTGSE